MPGRLALAWNPHVFGQRRTCTHLVSFDALRTLKLPRTTFVKPELFHAHLPLVERLAAAPDINHAGFDNAMVDGHPCVLEFNRLFGSRGLSAADDPVPAAIPEYFAAATGQGDPDDPSRPPLRLAA